MSTFLKQILEQKKREVEALYAEKHHSQLENQIVITTQHRDPQQNQHQYQHQLPQQAKRSLASALTATASAGKLGVIAEIKRASPSKGTINEKFDITERASAYASGGAAAISVLTDKTYFHGSISDLKTVVQTMHLPVLRKDFIIDEIQVEESSLAGADAILLIVAALPRERLVKLSTYAKQLGLDVLVEIHEQDEIEAALAAEPSVLGINNRNLHSFSVSLETSVDILKALPRTCPVISESGFQTADDVRKIAQFGISGILVGESLMRETSREHLEKLISAYSASMPTESGCKS